MQRYFDWGWISCQTCRISESFVFWKENSNSFIPESSLKKKVKYFAPEYFTDPRSRNSDKFDVYSFAILSWEILSLKEAYTECADKKEIQEKVGKGERPNILKLTLTYRNGFQKLSRNVGIKRKKERPTFKIISESLFAHIIKLQPEMRRSYVCMKDQELTKCWSICNQDFEKNENRYRTSKRTDANRV